MGLRGPSKGSKPHPMTPERVDLFLQVYRESGACFRTAAAAACPSTGKGANPKPCFSSFVRLRKSDMEFAAACDEILQETADLIEAEIDRRGRVGWLDPVFQKGSQAVDCDGKPAFIRRFDSKLLLARAKALMPDRFGDSKRVDLHHHKALSILQISPEDMDGLSNEHRGQLREILIVMQANRKGGVAAIEHKPAKTLDVAVVEIEGECEEVKVLAAPDTADLDKEFPY